ncbi:bifunctional nicotinamide-nucleotide adenylyltransferase/Nudix hydroxylase [Piscinibacter gummiphilus]|uniref:Cytidyltransferase n=1 Tax=Piscinibacter gummiphilus TaxID=946333 RepID=A0A1W6LEY9_9BURK|nr:bifunctional nicotinamide-nucleotide adenylyltransferase/Nudix hydroxylase [Piscinibacter gummiphilus]ARN22831.1 cytidyltransferase [Piscinibacter gummiphilus]ATU67529.1 cytidyltransferase [Piscinibacter gummiphilus]GLS96646.1 ADP-ribose pyrophosphatase [Piscinibacter gummiphilus]
MSAAQTFDVAVCVGRFQPFHFGHLALLHHALSLAPKVMVVIGSAFQARSPKNPFTWRERSEMIRLALGEADAARVSFLPVRDHYDEARWVTTVQAGVTLGLPQGSSVALVGHFKDATSGYLRAFAGWSVVPLPRVREADGTGMRDALFSAGLDARDATLAALVEQAPASTLAFLRAWLALPEAAVLAEEWRMLRQYKAAWSSAPYPPVFVTVDAVVQCAGHVLLVRRGAAPGKGLRAVPGGFIEQRETVYQSAVRELAEETGLDLLDTAMRRALREVAVFDHPDRSQRGRTITHAHHFDLGDRELPEVHGADDALEATWVPIDTLGSMEDQFHDDHFHMLDHFLGITPR